MQVKKVDVYRVEIEFSASDCVLLAEACHIAMDRLGSRREREGDYAHVTTMAVAFKAAAIGAYAMWMMRGCDLRALDECLVEVGLMN